MTQLKTLREKKLLETFDRISQVVGYQIPKPSKIHFSAGIKELPGVISKTIADLKFRITELEKINQDLHHLQAETSKSTEASFIKPALLSSPSELTHFFDILQKLLGFKAWGISGPAIDTTAFKDSSFYSDKFNQKMLELWQEGYFQHLFEKYSGHQNFNWCWWEKPGEGKYWGFGLGSKESPSGIWGLEFETDKAPEKLDVEVLHSITCLFQPLLQNIKPQTSILDESNVSKDKLLQIASMMVLGELTSGVAHDINNPLQVILGKSQLLMMKWSRFSGSDPKLVEELKVIEKNTNRISTLVKNLTDFYRRTKQAAGFDLSVDVNNAIKNAVLLIKDRFAGMGVEVNVLLNENLPKIQGNSNKLEQCFLNLIFIIKERLQKGGRLEIKSYPENSSTVVEFSDTGPVLPVEYQENILSFSNQAEKIESVLGLKVWMAGSLCQLFKGELVLSGLSTRGASIKVILPTPNK